MLSGVVSKIPRALDFRNVTPDELVVPAQGLSVPDDLPLFRSGCFRPGYLQDQVTCFDGFVVSLPVVTAGSAIGIPSHARLFICFVIAGVTGVNSKIDSSGASTSIIVLDTIGDFSGFSLNRLDILSIFSPTTLSLTPLRTSVCFSLGIPPLSSTFLFAPTTVVARPRSVQPE